MTQNNPVIEFKKKNYCELGDQQYIDIVKQCQSHIEALKKDLEFYIKQVDDLLAVLAGDSPSIVQELLENPGRLENTEIFYKEEVEKIREYIGKIERHKTDLERFKKLYDESPGTTGDDVNKRVILAPRGDWETIEKLFSVQTASYYFQPRFFIKNASGVREPLSEGCVLFWKYRLNRSNKTFTNLIKFEKNDSTLYSRFVGIGKTDRDGRLIYSSPFENKDDELMGRCEFSPATGDFRIIGTGRIQQQAHQLLETRPNEEFFGQQAMEIYASYPEDYIRAVNEDQNKSTQKWEKIPMWTPAYITEGEYGFMVFPVDMGDCEIKNLADLPNQSVQVFDKKLPIAVRQRINVKDPATMEIELPVTFREMTRQINLKRKKLQKSMLDFIKVNQAHQKNIDVLTIIKKFVEIVSSFKYEYDEAELYYIRKPVTDIYVESVSRVMTYEESDADYRIQTDPVKALYGYIRKFREETAAEYLKIKNSIPAVNTLNKLIEGIEDRLLNGEKYFLKNIPPEALEKEGQSVMDYLKESIDAIHNFITGEEDNLKRKFMTSDINYEKVKKRIQRETTELWDIIRSEPFRLQFSAYMKKSAETRLPKSYDQELANHLDKLEKYYDELLPAEELDDFNKPEAPKFKQTAAFPPSFDYMTADYYSGFVFEVLGHSLEMLDPFLGDQVYEDEIIKGIIALLSREEFNDMGDEIGYSINALAKKYRATDTEIKLTGIADTINKTSSSSSTGKLSNSILEIWARSWNTFKEYKDLLCSTVIPAPGPDNLLQATLKIFEKRAIKDSIKNQGNKGLYIHLMTVVVCLCRFQLSSKSRAKLFDMIADAFVDQVRLAKSKEKLNLFLHTAAYGGGAALPKAQVLAISAIKTGCTVLNLYSLWDEWEKLGTAESPEDFSDISRRIGNYLHFGVKSTSAASCLWLLGDNAFALAGREIPLKAFASRWANRCAFGLQVISAAEASVNYLHLYFREGLTGRALEGGVKAAGEIMLTTGLIFSAKTLLSLSPCLYLPGVGAYLFAGGIVLLFASGYTEELYNYFFVENTEATFNDLWEDRLVKSDVYKLYSDVEFGAKKNTLEPIEDIDKTIRSVKFQQLSWHAIIPLYNLGFSEEQIKSMIHFESMDSIELRHESAIAFTPKLEGFRVDADIVKKLISFYKLVSKDKNTTQRHLKFGSKTYNQIARELENGRYQPQTLPEIYLEMKEKRENKSFRETNPFPYEYQFLKHPFYSILPEVFGISKFCQRVIRIHDQNLLGKTELCEYEIMFDPDDGRDGETARKSHFFRYSRKNMDEQYVNELKSRLEIH